MIRQHSLRLWLLLCTMAAALIISGCGGGSSSGSATTPTTDDSATISGTAAAGAPVSGIVGARDASGETLTTTIETDGSFELDLSDLDTPVLLYASGIAGGNAYQMLSVAFADDLNGTANITPLTDLIVGNAVGRSPQEFFNNPDFDLIQQTAIETQEEALKTRLKPLLDALGVEQDFDLRNSPFTANRSGFDAALDVIEVQIDPDTNTASITNRVNPTQSITNNFVQPESEETTLEVNETEINEGVSTLQALNTLATSFADALEGQDETTLESLTSDFLNNGETISGLATRLSSSAAAIEDAGELAADIRNWSLAELREGTARLNVGQAQGPWQAINDNGDWKLQGNQAEFFVFVEPTHRYENGAESPVIEQIATLIYAGFPSASLGSVADSSVTVSGDLTVFNGPLPFIAEENRFDAFETLSAGDINSGDTVTFTWNNSVAGVIDSEASFTIRRGSPDFSNGAPEITDATADLAADEYTFQWTLPPGYDAVSVRNNFTGQTSGGQGGGFTGNPLANDATSFTGELPANYVPRETDQLRLIARDPFGVFVAARLNNPFAGQVPAPSEAGALVGSFIKRNTDRTDNAPWVHFTFFESGQYIHLELGDDFRPDADPNGNTGMEMGTYTWDNQTGDFEFTGVLIDQNGEWGASDLRAEEKPLRVEADNDGFTLNFANGDSLQFDRVPANSATGGVAGTWATQNPSNPDEVAVLTLLEDGFYFIGDAYNASGDEVPGIEFGEWTWDSESLVLDYITEYDQNGVGGLADNGAFNGEYLFSVVDGQLVVDQDGATQLSELASGIPVSNGDLTVDYTPPQDPAGPAITGNFHYLRSSVGIEGERVSGPAFAFMASYQYPGAALSDNGDGNGTLNYTDSCISQLLVEAGINSSPIFEALTNCVGASGSEAPVEFTQPGAILPIPIDTYTQTGGETVTVDAGEANLFATSSTRDLLLGFGKTTFQYDDNGSLTSGIETGVHMMAEKGSGMTTADMEGDWGVISMQLSNIEGFPDDIAYNVNALDVSVDNLGALTIEEEQFFEIIQGGNTSNTFVQFEENTFTPQETVGNFELLDDGQLGLFGGEFSGFVPADQSMFFLAAPDPTDATVTQDAGFQELLIGVRQGATPLQAADLVGKEYTRFGQFFWVQGAFFEVDYARPGSTLTFPVDSTIAEYRRQLDFTYTPFDTNGPVFTGESSNPVGYDFDYSVDANGLLRLTGQRQTADYTDEAIEVGWANADASVIVMTNYYVRVPSDGTGPSAGGVGVGFLVCTNCE
jgi:hypothetical protein